MIDDWIEHLKWWRPVLFSRSNVTKHARNPLLAHNWILELWLTQVILNIMNQLKIEMLCVLSFPSFFYFSLSCHFLFRIATPFQPPNTHTRRRVRNYKAIWLVQGISYLNEIDDHKCAYEIVHMLIAVDWIESIIIVYYFICILIKLSLMQLHLQCELDLHFGLRYP